MNRVGKISIIILVVTFVTIISLGVYGLMGTNSEYTLKPYTGVGSGVLKHGTIVKVVDEQPVVVGHFDDDSGKDYPGTVQIEEAK